MDTKNNKAIIFLGNGFDIAMGFKTKYSDFYDSKEFDDISKDNELVQFISKCINDDKSNGEPLWKDLEELLYVFAGQQSRSYYCGTDAEIASIFRRDFGELRGALFSYLNKTQETPIEDKQRRKLLCLVEQWKRFAWQVVTFNYTTLDMTMWNEDLQFARIVLNSDDTVNKEKFIYQHGKMYETHSSQVLSAKDIVLGIDKDNQKVDQNFSFLYKEEQGGLSNRKELSDYVAKKDVIILFGCSLGASDSFYSNLFFNCTNKTFMIYYYDNSSIKDLVKTIKAPCRTYKNFWLKNKVYFIKSKDVCNCVFETRKIIDQLLGC